MGFFFVKGDHSNGNWCSPFTLVSSGIHCCLPPCLLDDITGVLKVFLSEFKKKKNHVHLLF